MKPDLYWIPGLEPGRLAIAARPRGGDWLDDEARAWREAGVSVVVSLLESDEVEQLGLLRENEAAEANGIRAISFPIVDRSVPVSTTEALILLRQISESLAAGETVAVHCRQGIGRSGLVTAGVLITQGLSPEAAVDLVSSARGLRVPETPEQLSWLQHLPAAQMAMA
jgi:protein-tyrosine phosphatase